MIITHDKLAHDNTSEDDSLVGSEWKLLQRCFELYEKSLSDNRCRQSRAYARTLNTLSRSTKGRRNLGGVRDSMDRLSERMDSLALLWLCTACHDVLAAQQETSSTGTVESDSQGECSLDIPEFATQAEYDAWTDSLPTVDMEVDPRLLERVKTSIRLSRRIIDGYKYLAKQKGLRSGQTLMKIVLGNYLAKNLPPDF